MSDIFTITVQGLDQLKADFARMSNPAQFRAVMLAAGLIVETAFKKYPTRNSPTRASVYGSTFVSDKQRRFVMWAIRSGVIDIPYRRGQSGTSKNLQQSWSTRMISDTEVSIGTAVSYAPMVMDAERQSKYMAAVGWRSAQDIGVEVTPQVKAAIESGITKILGV